LANKVNKAKPSHDDAAKGLPTDNAGVFALALMIAHAQQTGDVQPLVSHLRKLGSESYLHRLTAAQKRSLHLLTAQALGTIAFLLDAGMLSFKPRKRKQPLEAKLVGGVDLYRHLRKYGSPAIKSKSRDDVLNFVADTLGKKVGFDADKLNDAIRGKRHSHRRYKKKSAAVRLRLSSLFEKNYRPK
jgi:hypothetical protein